MADKESTKSPTDTPLSTPTTGLEPALTISVSDSKKQQEEAKAASLPTPMDVDESIVGAEGDLGVFKQPALPDKTEAELAKDGSEAKDIEKKADSAKDVDALSVKAESTGGKEAEQAKAADLAKECEPSARDSGKKAAESGKDCAKKVKPTKASSSASASAGKKTGQTASKAGKPPVLVSEHEYLTYEQYLWKRNATELFDLCMLKDMHQPLHSAQWYPAPISADTEEKAASNYATHRILLGTRGVAKSDKAKNNYLMVAALPLPKDYLINSTAKVNFNKADEISRMDIARKVRHSGRVSRARYMPQNPTIVASRSADSNDVFIYNFAKEPILEVDEDREPDILLRSHEKIGTSLSWNPNNKGHLLTSSDDLTICLWDINQVPNSNRTLEPMLYTGHTQPVEDVAWNQCHVALFGSVATGKLMLWDVRSNNTSEPVQMVKVHNGHQVHCIAFNPFFEHLFATGSADKTVALWDQRSLKKPLHVCEGHVSEVWQLQWSPHYDTVLASVGGTGRRTILWDLSRIGDSQTKEEALEGPPEKMFLNGGHTSIVTDFHWHPTEEWVVGSVADNGILMVWKMNEDIFTIGTNGATDVGSELPSTSPTDDPSTLTSTTK